MHWLILFPYYFFGAVSLLLALLILCRLTRLPLRLRVIANIAATAAVLAIALPLTMDWVSRPDFTFLRVLGLAGVSFLLAGIDRVLARALAHPLDGELAQL